MKNVVNLDILNKGHMVIIGLNVAETRFLEKTAKKVQKFKNVLSVSIVAGRYDLVVEVLLDFRLSLVDFLSNELSLVPNIVNIESFIILKTYS